MGLFGGSPEVVGGDNSRLAQLEERVHRLETVVAQLLQQPAPPSTISPGEATLRPDFWGDAMRLKQQGNAIQAIKLVRERTGLGLREAKEAVDRL